MTIFSLDEPVSEVTATELGRTVSHVLDRVGKGERLIVTRNGRAAALIVCLTDGIEVMLAGDEHFTALRREAREELEAGLAATLERWRLSIESS
jgi:antitoxin (DNA-binding transcriptional repressor) of toxin-antitoxin stability system